MNASNISLFIGTPRVVLKILNLFEKETASAKILLLELNPERLGDNATWHKVLEGHDVFFSYYAEPSPFIQRFTRTSFVDLWKRLTSREKADTFDVDAVRAAIRATLPTRDMAVAKPPIGTSLQYYADKDGFTGKDNPLEVQAVRDIQKCCEARGILLTVLVMPQWYGQLNLSEQDLSNPPANDYIALLQELKAKANCDVIVCDDITKITTEGTDADYFHDYGHMTAKGAEVYTNWLVERMFESPKIAGVLNRRAQESETENAELKMAQPRSDSVR